MSFVARISNNASNMRLNVAVQPAGEAASFEDVAGSTASSFIDDCLQHASSDNAVQWQTQSIIRAQ